MKSPRIKFDFFRENNHLKQTSGAKKYSNKLCNFTKRFITDITEKIRDEPYKQLSKETPVGR